MGLSCKYGYEVGGYPVVSDFEHGLHADGDLGGDFKPCVGQEEKQGLKEENGPSPDRDEAGGRGGMTDGMGKEPDDCEEMRARSRRKRRWMRRSLSSSGARWLIWPEQQGLGMCKVARKQVELKGRQVVEPGTQAVVIMMSEKNGGSLARDSPPRGEQARVVREQCVGMLGRG